MAENKTLGIAEIVSLWGKTRVDYIKTLKKNMKTEDKSLVW